MNKLKKEYLRLVGIVKQHRLQENLPARYEDIAKELGYNRSYFSTLMGKRGVVTEDHIKLLKLTFPVVGEKEPGIAGRYYYRLKRSWTCS
jgi:hypothetical protein